MPSRIFSASMFGFECRLVEVEADILNGPSSISIVGLGDTSVQESKERIRSAIKNSGFEYPRRKKTINLAPADVPKHGPIFDLPIALALLLQSQQLPKECLLDTIVMGEVALSGEVRRIPGVLPTVAYAVRAGFKRALVPIENAAEAALVPGIRVIAVENLAAAVSHLRGESVIAPYTGGDFRKSEAISSWNFEDIYGQEQAKRALMIAAAGGHNILLYGPPGTGKTLLARSCQAILPPLTFDEALEVTKLYSIAGKLPPKEPLVSLPPFRSVHHTASPVSLIGGSLIPKPGMISLAHRGVLFIDELLEFPRASLDCLRQPLEDRVIHITRARGTTVFPAHFMLIAATNPCPCGYYGDTEKSCICTPSERTNYRKKLSGPLLDRIDLECYVPRNSYEKLALPFEERQARGGLTTEQAAEKVAAARKIQYERHHAEVGIGSYTNSDLTGPMVQKYCILTREARGILKDAFHRYNYSGRAYFRLLKVARTIADLEASNTIEEHHLTEALQYRPRFMEHS